MNNLERYKGDLERLIAKGEKLRTAMQYECEPRKFREELGEQRDEESVAEFIRNLPSFPTAYQAWYSEAEALIRQLLPTRLDDFSSYYKGSKTRKELTTENYRISDYLLHLPIEDEYGNEIGDPSAAIPSFQQQLAIVEAVKSSFESSLFKISQIVQADLFDSELEAAKALVKHGFLRAAGALAGVVMEKHLARVCDNHAITLSKRAPTIAELNDALKDVLDFPQWRANQRLGDIRNLCVHNKDDEPTKEQVNDLVDGVMKLTKTLF